MSKGLYPIRTISAMTGVNPVTLRAWERRYGLIRPQRTAKGHRLYTERDIDRIQQILVLLERGIPISQAQQVLDDDQIIVDPASGADIESDEDLSTWEGQRQLWLNALSGLDEHALDAAYSETLSLFPVDLVQGRLIRPLLNDILRDGGDTPESRARYRFLSAFLRNKLCTRFHHQAVRASGPKLLAALVPGEVDDVDLLMAAVSAQSHGYRVILLGAGCDTDTLIAAHHLSRSAALLISARSTTPPDDGLLAALRGDESVAFLLDAAAGWVDDAIGGNLVPVSDPSRLLPMIARHVPPATGTQRPRGS